MASLSSLSLCKSNSKTVILNDSRIHNPFCGYIKPHIQTSTYFNKQRRHRLSVVAVTEGSAKKSEQEDQPIPSWAKPDSEEPPPWARNEAQQQASSTLELPFYVYLLASAITAIAAVRFLALVNLLCNVDISILMESYVGWCRLGLFLSILIRNLCLECWVQIAFSMLHFSASLQLLASPLLYVSPFL